MEFDAGHAFCRGGDVRKRAGLAGAPPDAALLERPFAAEALGLPAASLAE